MDKTYIKKDCLNCKGSGLVVVENWSHYFQQNDLRYKPDITSITCTKCKGRGYVDTDYFVLQERS